MNSLNENMECEKEIKPVFKGYGKRHTHAIMIFCCMLSTSCVRGCLNVAILAMVDSSLQGNNTQTFDWDKPTQGMVMSAYYWGDTVMQIPAGFLVCRFGGKLFLTISVIANGISSLTIPWISGVIGWQGAFMNRVLLGLTSSFIFPSIHDLLGKWAPVSERCRTGVMIYSGLNIAMILGSPIAGYIATSSLGWPWIFYFFGIVCVVNVVIWMWFGASTPAEHRTITKLEKDYIESSLGETVTNPKVPWKSIIRSRPVIALIITQFLLFFAYSIMFVEIPTYFKIGLGVDMENSGLLSSLPYISSYAASIICSLSADYLLNKSIFSLTTIRKLFNTIGSLIPTVGLMLLVYVPKQNVPLAVFLIMVIIGGDTFSAAGFMLNHIDLSPNFAAIIVSWSLTISDIGNMIGPIMSGYIVADPSDISRWRLLFQLLAAIYFMGNLVFVIFGTGEKQPWNDLKTSPNIVLVPSDLEQELTLLRPTGKAIDEKTDEKNKNDLVQN